MTAPPKLNPSAVETSTPIIPFMVGIIIENDVRKIPTFLISSNLCPAIIPISIMKITIAPVNSSSKTILIGSEEGALSLVDFRANVVSLSAKLCTDYIGGVAVCSNGNMFAAAAADGVLRIYDARKFDEIVLQKDYDSPLRCCSAIGDIVLCGAEDGNLHSCSLQPGVSEAPRPVFDGASGGAINCISTYSVFSTQNSGNHCSIGLGFEDGSVCLTAF